MKKTIKAIMAVVMIAALALSLTACGVDMSKIKGDWTITKVNDQTLADYATSIGTTEDSIFMNFSIDDKNVNLTTSITSMSLTYKQKANGIDIYNGETVFGSFVLNSDGTLGYACDFGAGAVNAILTNGTYTPAASGETPVEDTPAEESGEDTPVEESVEDAE